MNTENNQKLITAFSTALEIEPATVIDELKYQSIPEWDSMSHMFLISELEEVFEVEIETDDVIDLSSVGKAKEILTKYDVHF